MKLQFKEQQFQLDAVKAVVDCFAGQPLASNRFTLERSRDIINKAKLLSVGKATLGLEEELMENIGYRNAPIQITDEQLLQNIKQVQFANDIPESTALVRNKDLKTGCNLTIEMETGTGKTYTYIRTMYELHREYGWSKFIVIVPSVAIREGVYKSFEVTQDHFQEIYNHRITPFIYNSARPQDIENFASDSRISVMIINTQAFNATGKDARRIKMELDQFGSRKPIEIIARTNPILIIDEPQSVDGEKTLESMQDFRPLFSLRYSATHRVEYNKVFRLDALDAYNRKLVKKIQVKGISLKGTTGTNGYLYLEDIIVSRDKPPVAFIEYEQRNKSGVVKRVREKLSKGANLFQKSGDMPQYKGFTIDEIDGYFNKIVISGQEIFAGEVIGDFYEMDFRRIQIRETILSHLKKEKQLFDKGIKVLSLFFIDTVENYKKYNELGEEEKGEYAKIFEEEYNKVKNDFTDLFHQEYNDYIEKTDVGEIYKGYMPTGYAEYLNRDDAEDVHKGYFSIDKKNRLADPSVKRGKEDSEDISAYDLIMKEKEKLLSFDEPTRFIFSHSALKEGWDNPNVFQICALKHSDAVIRRRQEVGRGMRLCVNDLGVRLDYDMVGEQVHEINKLTVIASESYEEFAKGLQSEISATLKDRPQKAEPDYFVGKVITDTFGQTVRVSEDLARKLNKFLYKNDILDDDDKITAEGKEKIDNNTVALPENLEPYRDSVVTLLKAIYTGAPIPVGNDRNVTTVSVNKNFHRKEFQELWNKISLKSIYEVQFDTDKLIKDSVILIDAELNIAERRYEVKIGDMETSTKQKIDSGEAIVVTDRKTKKLDTDIYTNTVYDIIGEIVTLSNLKRATVVEILKKIRPNKFDLLRKNPEEFIAKTAKLINEAKAGLIISNIAYHKTDERHDAKTVFANSKDAMRQSEALKKHIYDFLISDSQVEASFAKALEDSREVFVYAKLPKSFFITTPVANYSPDWAIVFDKDQVKEIYFVAETKGSDSSLDHRPIEKLKIHCAGEHFKEITNCEVKFARVSSYEVLKEMIELK